ncbi:Glycerophosphocholine phosphodiesterase gpcpd1 [Cichlidogyrus casuarinus]|uniref:Glycerophosphocholine phosphodiesterase gpcpd1 n=1 Tax=Cichlidogyrus casuarinus TaxID=1844966 RepID=A0ABD2QDT0_9PLAT
MTSRPALHKENTLVSLKKALQHVSGFISTAILDQGADFVEMDVQLTKDGEVILYHDYEAAITSRKKRRGELSYLIVPVKDLKYEVLKSLKTDHYSVMLANHDNESELLTSNPLFANLLSELRMQQFGYAH